MRDGHTHAWIESEGLVVDITADQFDDIELSVVVTREGTWYEQFTPVAGDNQKARISNYDPGTQRRLYLLYSRIVGTGSFVAEK